MTDTIIAIIVVALAATMCGFSLYRVLTGKAKRRSCGCGCSCTKPPDTPCDSDSQTGDKEQ